MKGIWWQIALLGVVAAVSGCGYHVAGHSTALPKNIKVIAVPAAENKSTTFKIEQMLTAATIHEFLAQTNYKIVSDANAADAVLTSKVLGLEVNPLLFQQPQTSTTVPGTNVAQATAMMVTMRCEVTLTERDNDKVLYHTDNFVFRNEYQLATAISPVTGTPTKAQVETFFQEFQPAMGRMSQDFASRLVAAIVENY